MWNTFFKSKKKKINNPIEKCMKGLNSYFIYKKTRMAKIHAKMLKLSNNQGNANQNHVI